MAPVHPTRGTGREAAPHGPQVERDTHDAHAWLRPFSRRRAAREARALLALRRVPGVPRLVSWDGRRLRRSWLEGLPLHDVPPRDRGYFREALRLLRRLHAAGIVHNDLAREANWLVAADGSPGLVGFRRALQPRHRGWRFRACAHGDLRHLLEHKRAHCPHALTARERAILARRCWLVEAWLRAGESIATIRGRSSRTRATARRPAGSTGNGRPSA